jgi:hypothetical protein
MAIVNYAPTAHLTLTFTHSISIGGRYGQEVGCQSCHVPSKDTNITSTTRRKIILFKVLGPRKRKGTAQSPVGTSAFIPSSKTSFAQPSSPFLYWESSGGKAGGIGTYIYWYLAWSLPTLFFHSTNKMLRVIPCLLLFSFANNSRADLRSVHWIWEI